MLSKRFLMTSTPFFFLALAGMGLATAQSNSPFASKSKSQAWEDPPAQSAAPQSWSVPASQTPAQQSQPAPVYSQPSYAPSTYAPPSNAAPTYAPPSNAAPSYSPPTYSEPAYAAPTSAPRIFAEADYSAPSYSEPSYSEPAVPASADAPIATTRRRNTPLPSFSANTPPKTFGGRSAAPTLAGGAPRSYGNVYVEAPDLGSPAPPSGRPRSAPASASPYSPRSGGRPQAWETPPANAPQNSAPNTQPNTQGQPYPNQNYGTPPVFQQPGYGQNGNPPSGPTPNGYAPNGYAPNSQAPTGYQSSTPPTGAPYGGGPYSGAPQGPRSWIEKLGLKNLATNLSGKLILGAAATYREQPPNQLGPDDAWSDDEIADAELEFEISAITDNGLEYGAALGVRAQYDRYRRGFGGQLPDCPAGVTGCSGTTDSLRGHTSGFYSGGEDITKDAQFGLETAHLFLRSAYGDVTLGRDDGAAYLFSLGAPTLLAVAASNSPVDYTGFDSVKTVNDASGFAEKVTYTTPRLLGDQIGLGVQLGVSYALDGDVCGVDYCNGKDITGILQPEIEDIFEAGLALDRTFDNGIRAEITGTYARGSEKSGGLDFDDLESFGAGLELGYGKWTLGGSYLQSNNGLLNGDYTAYDAGITWKPGALGFTLGYGHAEDENVGLESDQAVFGVTYDFNKFTIGTGVQYVNRDVNGVVAGIPTTFDQHATSAFIQAGFKF